MNLKIKDILELISRDGGLDDCLASSTAINKHLNVSGLSEQQKGYMAAAIAHRYGKKPFVVAPDSARAKIMARSISPWVNGEVVILNASELSLVTAESSSHDPETLRLGTIARLYSGDAGAVVISADALLNKLTPAKEYEKRIIRLKFGGAIAPEELSEQLVSYGYTRVGAVAAKGEFSWRGDVFDIYSPNCSEPYRLSFFDDEIDQVKIFDKDTQRSIENIKEAVIVPATEYVFDKKDRIECARKINEAAAQDINDIEGKSSRSVAELLRRTTAHDSEAIQNGVRISGIARWLGVILDNPVNILDYMDKTKFLLFVDELADIKRTMDGYLAEFYSRVKMALELGNAPSCANRSVFKTADAMKSIDSIGTTVAMSSLSSSGNGLPGGKTYNFLSHAGDSWRGREKELADRIKKSSSMDTNVILMVTGTQRVDGLRKKLLDEGATPVIFEKALPSGFVSPTLDLMVIGEQDIFGSDKKITNNKNKTSKLNFFSDIAPGDYVVHDAHGIGRYEGIVNRRIGGSAQDYLQVSFAKNAVIYLPLDKLDKLQKYVGPNNREPKLSSLDSQEWSKSVNKARTAVKAVAYDLLKLYAARRANKGYTCLPDDDIQKEFEDNFPYCETEDQLRAIKDIKRDMESDIPMDRLLCGDVGFGKTEVAFRAIMKCVTSGRQAIMIAPTTLLAQQHFDNFIERLNGLPVRVALLSRFVQPAVLKQHIKDIKAGKVDVVIGTHRALSDDVEPANIGLLVVDEEQRFGVNHKEKIKAMKNNIDVLTLTATPIPRTLHMSMSGIRDISVLDEAPMNRRPVQTYVMPYEEEIIVQACQREIARGGQVFFLHNKTSDIDTVAGHLSEIMPGTKVVYAHGKMSEHQMERIIESFVRKEADILVCTTIIESGVDMPNVNTMIVEDANHFGLAQLYQIKGRVGRSDKQAYAYITYKDEDILKEEAKKRLMAIREFTELGSGVKIALRDLEVRGAGDILGAEQHGQMDVIGYELYCRLLDEEIKMLRDDGDTILEPQRVVNLEVDFDSYIPTSYIEDETTRMLVYRRIANIRTAADYDSFIDECTDRYGDMPREVMFLAGAAYIRALAAQTGFERVVFKDIGIHLYFANDRKMDMPAISKLIGTPEYAGRILISAVGKPYMHYKPKSIKHDASVNEVIELFKILLENRTV